MRTQQLFNEHMPKTFSTSPDKAKELNAIFLFKISGDSGGTWTVDTKADTPVVKEGEAGTADCTIECSDEDFDAMLKDPQQGMQLFFAGKIKITGDPMLATKLQNLFTI